MSSASGRGHLHAIGQLEALDAGGQFRLGRMLLELLAIEPSPASRAGRAAATRLMSSVRIEIVDRRPLRLQRRALVDARQEARAPVLRMPLGQAAAQRVVHDDERRQVLAFAAQAIGHPRADARESPCGSCRC